MLHDVAVSVTNLVHDFVQLAGGLGWAIVLLVAVVLLRQQLASLIEAQFVALIDREGRFRELVDRALLERAIQT